MISVGRITTPLRSITAATTTTLLHEISPGRTAIVRKIMINNRNGTSGNLRLGSTDSATGGVGGVFTQRQAEIDILTGIGFSIPEEDLPNYEYRLHEDLTTDIVMQATVGAAAVNDVQVQAEIEEFEGD